jgi:hypothetical protein
VKLSEYRYAGWSNQLARLLDKFIGKVASTVGPN